ncbi:hypothetical protein [Variovorax sp.]|uniref:hypothetical protein n=1 Tax=Variovorax sp. TaxID=1871043 RepID=UPI003BAB6A84
MILAEKNPDIAPTPSLKEGITPRPELKQEPSKDAFGSFGSSLTTYHVGDITGLLGILITIYAAFQATSAKKAAKIAASTALKSRDQIEITSRLTDLSSRLKVARDVYNSDDWSRLAHLQDEIVAISAEIKMTEKIDSELIELMESIEVFARKGPHDFKHLKDDETKAKAKYRQAKMAIDFADKANSAKLRKVKNGA